MIHIKHVLKVYLKRVLGSCSLRKLPERKYVQLSHSHDQFLNEDCCCVLHRTYNENTHTIPAKKILMILRERILPILTCI